MAAAAKMPAFWALGRLYLRLRMTELISRESYLSPGIGFVEAALIQPPLRRAPPCANRTTRNYRRLVAKSVTSSRCPYVAHTTVRSIVLATRVREDGGQIDQSPKHCCSLARRPIASLSKRTPLLLLRFAYGRGTHATPHV